MSSPSTLLSQPRLTVVTGQGDYELQRICEIVEHKATVDGRGDLEALLGVLLAHAVSNPLVPKTLDLIGHSVPGTAVLQLGEWVIDTARPGVTAFFRGLADHDVLPRLGIHAVRLLGCRTAETAQARRTIVTLSEILGLEVYGTTGIVFANHYNTGGFDNAWRFLLVGASDLRREVATTTSINAPTSARTLDMDALPVSSLESTPWPCHVADAHTTRAILRLIRRNEGASMPGLLAMPRCEVAVPSSGNATAFHHLQLVLDGDFVRVYPDGTSKPGVLYPVVDPHVLRILVDKLPQLGALSSSYGETQRTPML
jgi:hypothetical protein